MMDPALVPVIDFWCGIPGSPERDTFREIWFLAATPEFDAEIRDRFLGLHERAVAGGFAHVLDSVDGCFALLLLFDQFPRNMFRGQARAFATDARAREVAAHAIAKGFDRDVASVYRVFFYLPYEHSESLADQERGLELMKALDNPRAVEASLEHIDVIKRFGRFPHRNAVLGRASTPEEIEYLKDGKSWGQRAAVASAR
jgi:uncharacterized protein (DUF924 family)